MAQLSMRNIFLSLALILPIISTAADTLKQPNSELNEGAEIFSINCHGMPQQTTIDMNACVESQLAEVEWVKDKYLTASLNRLKQDDKDDPESLQQLTTVFDNETKAWADLIDKASKSVAVNYAGGTISSTLFVLRKIGLVELQVHDIWDNWLRFGDSTPPVLPEPKFKSDQ